MTKKSQILILTFGLVALIYGNGCSPGFQSQSDLYSESEAYVEEGREENSEEAENEIPEEEKVPGVEEPEHPGEPFLTILSPRENFETFNDWVEVTGLCLAGAEISLKEMNHDQGQQLKCASSGMFKAKVRFSTVNEEKIIVTRSWNEGNSFEVQVNRQILKIPKAPEEADKVPIFVAFGRGGRTITSCDDGRTWIADRSINTDNRDHAPYVDKGAAYGDGVFMQVMGWGYDSTIQRSRDGIRWDEIKLKTGGNNLGYAGGGAFVVFRGNEVIVSKDGGLTWSPGTPPNTGSGFREGGGGGDAQGKGIIAGGGSFSPPAFSTDMGKSWSQAPEKCAQSSDFAGVGFKGGIAFGEGTLSIVSRGGKFCMTSDFGKSWHNGSISSFTDSSGGGGIGKLSFASGSFWMPVGTKVHRSRDGRSWETIDHSPSGISIHAMAASDKGTFVGLDKKKHIFYRSSDGIHWQKVSTHPSEVTLQRIYFGYGEPSKNCPR